MTRRAFTLIELLVVISIIGLLIGILVPVLVSAREAAYGSSCLSNQRQLMIAVSQYAYEHDDQIPFGPDNYKPNGADDFYRYPGMTTSQISLNTGEPVGAGLLIRDYLIDTADVLFCPGSDQPINVDSELGKVGLGSAVSAYLYRHGSTTLSDVIQSNIHGTPLRKETQLDNLGQNSRGEDIAALFLDYNFLLTPGSSFYDAFHRTNHGTDYANAAYSDGHAEQLSNSDGRYSVSVIGTSLQNALNKMVPAMEEADVPD